MSTKVITMNRKSFENVVCQFLETLGKYPADAEVKLREVIIRNPSQATFDVVVNNNYLLFDFSASPSVKPTQPIHASGEELKKAEAAKQAEVAKKILEEKAAAEAKAKEEALKAEQLKKQEEINKKAAEAAKVAPANPGVVKPAAIPTK